MLAVALDGLALLPNEPPPALVAIVTTGAALTLGEFVETTVLVILGRVATVLITVMLLVDDVCEPIAAQGGPLGQPVMTN